MQCSNHKNILERFIFYIFKCITGQFKKGDKFIQFNKVIGIFLLDFNLYKDKYIHDILALAYKLRTEIDFSYIFEMHVVELKKFKAKKLITDYDKWLYVFNNSVQLALGEIEIPKPIKDEEIIMTALERVKEVNSDLKKRAQILSREKFLFAQKSQMSFAMEEGIKKGSIEGKLQQALQIYQSNIIPLEVAKKLIQEELGKGYDDLVQEYLAKLDE